MKRKMTRITALLMGAVMSVVTVWGSNHISAEAAQERILPEKPVYDVVTDTTDWDYVYFGSYPQRELSGEAVTGAIVEASYDVYGDAVIDGQKYRRIRKRDANYSSDMVVDGFYDWSDKGYVYYQYEPIKWRVLDVDGESLLLMADSVLDCRRYCQNDGNVTWETSAARRWLNNYDSAAIDSASFLGMAFSEEEQKDILTTTVANSDNLLHKTTGGNSTQDKIFLLSIRDMVNEAYGFPEDFMLYSKTRQLEPTDYAKTMGVWMGTYNEQYGDYCWWLLRSTGSHTKAVSLVYRFGNVYQDGYYANTPYYGACPALRVDIDSDQWILAEEEETKTIAEVSVQEQQTADVTNKKTGDADLDGDITLQDAQLILKVALKITGNASELMHCDVDAEGTGITLVDAQFILKYALRIIDKFPVESENVSTETPTGTETPDVVTSPAVSGEPGTSDKPGSSAVPEESEAPTTSAPIRPEMPSFVPITPKPEVSLGPLVQEQHDASGVMWIAADSIAVEYNDGLEKGLCGWGEVIGEYFNDEFVVENKAIGGRSSRSFTNESNYDTIMDYMSEGDYLFISFGHNDERAAVELYTDPYGDSSTERSYKWYLKECYIDPAIRAGVQPVLVSPVVRRYFYDGKLINPQLHTPYAKAMEELVQEYADMGMTVYYIDLHSTMMDLYEQLGEDGTEKLHASNDTTHLCRAGIDIVCDYMVDEMKKQDMNIISFLK